MVRGVRVRGPFTGPSGYDHHVREFVRGLSQRGVPAQLENLNEWSPVRLPHEYRDPWFESLTQPVDASVTLHFSFPDNVPPDPTRTNANFTMFEATRIPRAWVNAHPASDLIVLPTEHSYRAWVDSGVPESKLRLCPLGVRADRYRPGVPPLALGDVGGRPVSSYAVRFLNVSEQGPRKNLCGLVTAWLRATTRADDAVLVMKIGCYTPGSLAEFKAELAAASEAAARSFDDAAPIHFVYNMFPDADMPRLFAAATHYISLSFGEGWDLPMTEAAVSGLRLIAPAHSGYLTYLDADIATMLPAREAPAANSAHAWMQVLFGGANWWQPDETAAVEAIRRAIAGQDTPIASARERIASRFTWDAAADRLVEILDEAEAMTGR